jgi:hypothetical protein
MIAVRLGRSVGTLSIFVQVSTICNVMPTGMHLSRMCLDCTVCED